jgi:hypothetical protein
MANQAVKEEDADAEGKPAKRAKVDEDATTEDKPAPAASTATDTAMPDADDKVRMLSTTCPLDTWTH